MTMSSNQPVIRPQQPLTKKHMSLTLELVDESGVWSANETEREKEKERESANIYFDAIIGGALFELEEGELIVCAGWARFSDGIAINLRLFFLG